MDTLKTTVGRHLSTMFVDNVAYNIAKFLYIKKQKQNGEQRQE